MLAQINLCKGKRVQSSCVAVDFQVGSEMKFLDALDQSLMNGALVHIQVIRNEKVGKGHVRY